MIVCLDVAYEEKTASACVAGLGFHHWEDEAPAIEVVLKHEGIAPYEPGQFYLRELPCLLAALKQLPTPDVIVVDGYVWLEPGHPGLGARLHEALGGQIAVVGVAKRPYKGCVAEVLLRGESQNPLYITAAGMDAVQAAQWVRQMHGPYRIPTLIRRVDSLCRGHIQPASDDAGGTRTRI